MTALSEPPTEVGPSFFQSFFRGMQSMVSIPALILTAAFVGYAGLARESGLTLGHTLVLAGLVWALPSVVVLTGALTSGASMLTAAIAVALASVRLMPMTVALMPMLRVEGKTKRWQLLIASHFVAVTAWVYAMKHMPDMPREARLPFFLGFAGGLSSFVVMMTAVSYLVISDMPPMVAGALFMLTPVYFTCSLWGASRLSYDKAAMILGLFLGPFFHVYAPGLDLLWTGLVGGTLAYAGVKAYRRAVQ
ncbi:AzlC family ABC transporter permease [Stappia sp. F7233]|uniref:AzlC family ABC transporter permease n=1 Tax=Stappia albiluteola TaxID=2758565 RepID=A0A839AE83_9HYPH|nr:AzlC family ABC transporter permease [Stappia albiluteola]MBA5777993.1 AzlC family ABC transporter permease [Stappia albiluteola]